MCHAGYAVPTSDDSSFKLNCSSNGTFVIPATASCAPLTCRKVKGLPVLQESMVYQSVRQLVSAEQSDISAPLPDYHVCIGKRTGDSCIATCRTGFHASKPLYPLNCADSTLDPKGKDIRCVPNTCMPPGDHFTGFNFKDDKCTTVQGCLHPKAYPKAHGMDCRSGHVRSDHAEGGLQVECREDGGNFTPTGCNGVVCPEHAADYQADGNQRVCVCEPGFEGGISWIASSEYTAFWNGSCTPIVGYAGAHVQSESGEGGEGAPMWTLWMLILLLAAIVSILIFFLTHRRMFITMVGDNESVDVVSPPRGDGSERQPLIHQQTSPPVIDVHSQPSPHSYGAAGASPPTGPSTFTY